MNNNERVIEVKRNGTWFKTRMDNLRPDEVFRMYEPNGSIIYIDDKSEFTVAHLEPMQCDDGTWVVLVTDKYFVGDRAHD